MRRGCSGNRKQDPGWVRGVQERSAWGTPFTCEIRRVNSALWARGRRQCKGPGAGGSAPYSKHLPCEPSWVGLRFPVPEPCAQAQGSAWDPVGFRRSCPRPSFLSRGAFRGLTVLVDEDVHGVPRALLLHGRLGPTDDLQDGAVLLGRDPVDDLPLSVALET